MQFLKSSRVAVDRMMRAYRMMLDFFGIELKNEASGKLQRAKNWEARMAHLNQFVSVLVVIVTAHCCIEKHRHDCEGSSALKLS